MGAGELAAVVTRRLKREEYKRTKHDSDFSNWKVLVGPFDWKDYSQGKEGAQRYRVHNLPKSSGPGLYELGIAVSHTSLGREVHKLDLDCFVVVYLGQADNVRTRLQCYGRSGAHLGNSYSTCDSNDCESASLQKGPGLFEEIFSKGYSIVYRWAPMKNKRDAEKTEGQLLDTFDYAWNRGGNGTRRPSDILQKLKKIASSSTRFSNIPWKLLPFSQKEVGIRIKASKPLSSENKPSFYADAESSNFLSGIFKFGSSRPRLVSDRRGINEDFIPICGVILNDGTPCRRTRVPGRKRCEEHKGRRILGSSSVSITEGKSHYVHDVYLDPSAHYQEFYTTCGVNLGDGSFCRRQPVVGRKRCEEHKGMRVIGYFPKSAAEEKSSVPAIGSVLSTDNWSQGLSFRRAVKEDFSTICGATLENGSFCKRLPVEGNKRCWQHKGRRVDGSLSRSSNSFSGFDTQMSLATCGVTFQNGSICMRAPVHGRKRCEQHKGMRVTTS